MRNRAFQKFIFFSILFLCLTGISEANLEPMEYENASEINCENDIRSYTYTADGKISTITYPDNSTTTFAYDSIDRITSMTDSIGTMTYVYDDVNRTITVTDANGFAVIHKYDAVGNLLELTYPGNKKIIYGYDTLNRLQTVRLDWLNPAQTATYSYDNAGRLTSLTNFNGSITTYGYDNANRLVSLENKKSDASTIATYSYTLNAVGNITQSVQDEPLSPVFTSGTTNYTYNAQKTRLLSAGSDTFTYDNEGQLASGYGNTYAFDYEHRLSSISGAFNAMYSYDGLGNRLKAIRNGTTTKYLYDIDGNVIAEADNSNNILKYYVNGIGLIALVTPTDSVYTYHFNNIGNTIAITDSTQNMVNKYSYDPFGVILNQVEAVSQSFKYVGQYGVMAEPNGFYYMLTRYLDPKAGIFTSEDTIGFAGGDANLKRYVENNPVTFFDHLGLMKLPGNPSGLGTEWKPDPKHIDPKDPGKKLFRDPTGRPLAWHPKQPGASPKTWKGKDHWHDPSNFGKKHLKPGCEVPDPAKSIITNPAKPTIPWWQKIPARLPGPLPIIVVPPGGWDCIINPNAPKCSGTL